MMAEATMMQPFFFPFLFAQLCLLPSPNPFCCLIFYVEIPT